MTAKKAYRKIYLTIILIIITVIFYVYGVSKLELGWSFAGFMFCAILTFIFSYKALKTFSVEDELKVDKTIKNMPSEFYDWITFFSLSIMLMFMLFMFFILPTTVSQTSMTPTLNDRDRVLIYHYNYEPKKGDIVVIFVNEKDYPRINIYSNKTTYFVKRIVGLPGDKITFFEIEDYYFNIYINDELYKNSLGEIYKIKEYQMNELKKDLENNLVPNNKYLVFGDNESGSQDSRTFGPVFEKDIIGKVIYKLWPLGKVD